MKKAVLKGLAAGLMLAVAGLWSCTPSEGGVDKINTLELSSTDDAVFPATVTDAIYVTVTTDAGDWDFEITVGDEWIDAFRLNDELEIRPRNNSTANQRVGRITFTAGTAEPVHLMVVQAAPEVGEDVLEVDPTETITFQQKSNRDAVLTVKTNVPEGYKVEAPEWVLLTEGEETLTVNVTDNMTDATRSGRLTITAGDAEPVYITVVQHNYVEQSESTTGHLEGAEGKAEVMLTLTDTEANKHEVYTGTLKVSLDSATSEDVKLTISLDEEYLTEYNFTHGTNYELYPSEFVSFTNGQEVTIAAGEAEAEVEFTMTIDDESLLYNDRYLLTFAAESQTDNMEMAYADSYVTYVLTKKMQKEVRNVVFPEVNDTNPLNALEVRLKDGQYFFDAVVLFAANLNYNSEEDLVYLSNNPNVQALLDNTETYLQPLREKGIKVYLGLLNNHDRAGQCGLSEWGCKEFAKQIADACLKYKLDGVNMDEEYASYQYGDYGRWFAYPSAQNGSRLAYEMKKAMNETCDWPCEVSYFSYSTLGTAYTIEGMKPGEFIDFTVGNYGGSGAQFDGMTLKQVSRMSVECNLGGGKSSATESIARASKENGYGWWMWFAWDLDPNKSRDALSYINNVSKGLYGVAPEPVTGYYRKIGEGVYDPVRYTR